VTVEKVTIAMKGSKNNDNDREIYLGCPEGCIEGFDDG
jgi:hypothetical protein